MTNRLRAPIEELGRAGSGRAQLIFESRPPRRDMHVKAQAMMKLHCAGRSAPHCNPRMFKPRSRKHS
jgi:hypothetical protein